MRWIAVAVVAVVVLVTAIVASASPQGAAPPTPKELADRIEALTRRVIVMEGLNEELLRRVTRLERLAAGEPPQPVNRVTGVRAIDDLPIQPPQGPGASSSFLVEATRAYEPRPEERARLEELRAQADAMRRAGDARQASVLERRATRLERAWAECTWLLGWDGTRDVMVLVPFGGRHNETYRGRFLTGSGVEIERGEDDGRPFLSIWAMSLEVLPAKPDLPPRERKAVWEENGGG